MDGVRGPGEDAGVPFLRAINAHRTQPGRQRQALRPAWLAFLLLACADDGDGLRGKWDCSEADPEVHVGAPERCNGIDDDCDGQVDEGLGWLDLDQDGWGDEPTSCDAAEAVGQRGDCDDANPLVHPEAEEACNDIDDDCDGIVDESGEPRAWYVDFDHDGYGRPEPIHLACAQPGPSWTSEPGDCDDWLREASPAAVELCTGGHDEDCDGWIDGQDPDCADSEDCANGGDDDLDGLVDCEDGDCAAWSGCFEDCASVGDEDGDGLADCEDPACGGAPGCGSLTVRRRGVNRISREMRRMALDIEGCDGTSLHLRLARTSFAADNVRGSAVTTDGDACRWGVERAEVAGPRWMARTGSQSSLSRDLPLPALRSGLWAEEGCGLGSGAFLPARLDSLGRAGAISAQGSAYGSFPWYSIPISGLYHSQLQSDSVHRSSQGPSGCWSAHTSVFGYGIQGQPSSPTASWWP